MSERAERCETCRFWDGPNANPCSYEKYLALAGRKDGNESENMYSMHLEWAASGMCCRYPPTNLLWEGELLARRPHVEPDCWCGEYQPAGVPAEIAKLGVGRLPSPLQTK